MTHRLRARLQQLRDGDDGSASLEYVVTGRMSGWYSNVGSSASSLCRAASNQSHQGSRLASRANCSALVKVVANLSRAALTEAPTVGGPAVSNSR